MASDQTNDGKVRLDKWLWAARFFKTRALAKEAIEGGKVRYNGARTKPGKVVEVGAELSIRQGWAERTVTVLGLSEQRRGAPEARSEEHTSELQSRPHLVCRLLLEKKNTCVSSIGH